jgi:hypothetical protein
MVALLGAIVTARACGVFGVVDPMRAMTAELFLVVALALSAAAGPLVRCVLAVTVATALGVATTIEPYETAIVLAVLHNFTPLAFLWEITPRHDRARVMILALTVFVALPLLVATGLPRQLLAALSLPSLDPLAAGPLSDQLYVYAPASLLKYANALDLFTASVVAQCAHYAAVILVLPAMLGWRDPNARGLVPWPKGAVFWALLLAASIVAVGRFTQGFASARALYGIAASVHAWIEVPVIVIALTGAYARNVSNRPTAKEAALVASDNTNDLRGDSITAQPMIAASTSTTTVSQIATAGK